MSFSEAPFAWKELSLTKLLAPSEARVANKNGSLMEFELQMPQKVYAWFNHRCMYVHACMYVCIGEDVQTYQKLNLGPL